MPSASPATSVPRILTVLPLMSAPPAAVVAVVAVPPDVVVAPPDVVAEPPDVVAEPPELLSLPPRREDQREGGGSDEDSSSE